MPRQERIRRAPVDENTVATLESANDIYLEVQARPGDSYVSLSMRYGGSELHWAEIENANDRRGVAAGLFYAIPFTSLEAEYRARAVTALFPGDGPGEEGWVHHVPPGDDGQTLESVALWFTGDAGLADDLAETNGVEWAPLPADAEVVIPDSILAPQFERPDVIEPAPEAAAKPEPPGSPEAPSVDRAPAAPVTVGDLTFVEDDTGGYAIYRLKRGEALYSAVVTRFTGRLDPAEVTSLAERIAQKSRIRSMTSIPIGARIRIPRDLILPQYLPPDDPDRVAYETGLAAARKHQLTVRARDLDGVAIILDAGHGGDDVGTQRNGVHEDDYVYDIMCRIKSLAESTTGAKVLTTIKDRSSGFKPLKGPFRIDRDEYLLTSPPFEPRKPYVGTVGVNLRWYLVNSYYRSLVRSGTDPQKVVFMSIHADSLHPSVRGAMVYVPGQEYRLRTYGHVGKLYQRKEVKELRYVKFSADERERSEGLSRRLATGIIRAFTRAGIGVHRDDPIRDHVIRGRHTYAPAVIRFESRSAERPARSGQHQQPQGRRAAQERQLPPEGGRLRSRRAQECLRRRHRLHDAVRPEGALIVPASPPVDTPGHPVEESPPSGRKHLYRNDFMRFRQARAADRGPCGYS